MGSALTPTSAARGGLSRTALYRAVQDGSYQRIARGIYLPADADTADWDWIEATTRRSDATICLTSALAHHDLTTSIPAALDIAIPRGARRPAGSSSIAWHHFDRASFPLGRAVIAIPGTDLTIGIYSAERSIADAFRLRGEVGYDLAVEALRTWLDRGGQPARIAEMASRLPRARGPLLHALDVLT